MTMSSHQRSRIRTTLIQTPRGTCGTRTVAGTRREGTVSVAVILNVFVCLTAALLVWAPPVGACTCQRYGYGFLVASGAVLPADAVGLPWWGAFPWEDEEIVAPPREWFRIERLDESGRPPLPVAVRWIEDELTSLGTDSGRDVLILVGPKGGLEPGASYVFTYTTPGGDGHPGWPRWRFEESIEVTVSRERVAWPRAGGAGSGLRILEERLGVLKTETRRGLCSTSIPAAQLVLELGLPEGLERWQEVLSFSVLVDSKPWRPSPSLCLPTPPGRTSEGPGRTRLFADCSRPDEEIRASPSSRLAEGSHSVRILAWLPGVEGRFEAAREIHLSCARVPDLD